MTLEGSPKKRLTTVVRSTTAHTAIQCSILCVNTDGCLAVSVTQAAGDVICNLSSDTDTEDDPNSIVYAMGKSKE